MPPIRNLTVTPTRVTPEPMPKAETALAPIANAPAWLATTAGDPLDADDNLKGVGESNSVYVGQLQENTGAKAQILAAGGKVGDFYLNDRGSITPLGDRPTLFFIYPGFIKGYMTQMDEAGKIVAAVPDPKAGLPKPWAEHFVTVVLVKVGGELVPAKGDFRKAAQKVAANALAGIRAAASPDFAGKSDAHRVAAQFEQPWGRVVADVVTGRRVGGNGKAYFAAESAVRPTTIAEQQLLRSLLGDADFNAKFDVARKSFEDRVAIIEKVIQK